MSKQPFPAAPRGSEADNVSNVPDADQLYAAGLVENVDLRETAEKQQRRKAVLDRMAADALEADKKVAEITDTWLRLTKGFSPTAIAQAIATDTHVRNILNVATTLANAYEPDQETPK